MTKKSSELTINANRVLGSGPIGRIFYCLLRNGTMTQLEIEKHTRDAHSTVSQYLHTKILWSPKYKEPLFKAPAVTEVYRGKWAFDRAVFKKLFEKFLCEGGFKVKNVGKLSKRLQTNYAGKPVMLTKRGLVYAETGKPVLLSAKRDLFSITGKLKTGELITEPFIPVGKRGKDLTKTIKKDTIAWLKLKQLREETLETIVLPNLEKAVAKISEEEFKENHCLGFLFARAIRNSGKWERGTFSVSWKKGKQQITISKDFNNFIDFNDSLLLG